MASTTQAVIEQSDFSSGAVPTVAPLNPSGLCQCGCGELAPLAPCTNRYYGYVKDEPMRFIAGHASRLQARGNKENWIETESGCWEWQGAACQGGYGMVRVGGRDGKSVLAHRYWYEQARGSIPDGCHLHHTCHNPACVNLDHLEVLTPSEHARERRANKLTVEAVREIRHRAAKGEGATALARSFGVTRSTTHRVISGRTWVGV